MTHTARRYLSQISHIIQSTLLFEYNQMEAI